MLCFGANKGMLPVKQLAKNTLGSRLLWTANAYLKKEGATAHPGMCKHGLQYDGMPDWGRDTWWYNEEVKEAVSRKREAHDVKEAVSRKREAHKVMCQNSTKENNEKERGKVWKDYMERIMNEENDFDRNSVEGPVDHASKGGATGIK